LKHITNIAPNTKFFTLLFALLFTSFIGNAGSLEALSKSLSTGEMDGMQKYFANHIEITFVDHKNILDQDKATEFINNFLEINKVVQFTIQKSSKSNSTSQNFAIGTLVTKNKTYKVFITLSNDELITQIQFK
jgi:Domain of unknown function (DUF4783)